MITTDCFRLRFAGHHVLAAATTAGAGPLVQRKTGANAPDIAAVDGALVLSLSDDVEAQVNGAYMGDVLPFRLRDIKSLRVKAKMSGDEGDNVHAIIGLIGDANDDPDAIEPAIFFKIIVNSVFVECADGANVDTDDVDTLQTLDDTYKVFQFDFDSGVVRNDPRNGGSKGGLADILPAISDVSGRLARVARSTVYDLSVVPDERVQLIFQIAKAESADTGELHIAWVEVELREKLES